MNLSNINFETLNRTYRITPIQQPEKAPAFRGAYLSRLPVGPPLILQFDCWDSDGNLEIPYDELPFLVCHLTLQKPDGEDAQMVISEDGETVAMLYGTLVMAPTEMLDLEGAQGLYFAFPDVSVRYVGEFRLKASLMRITGSLIKVVDPDESSGQPLDTCVTETIEVVEVEGYVASAVTDLTRHFDRQGVVRFGLPRTEW